MIYNNNRLYCYLQRLSDWKLVLIALAISTVGIAIILVQVLVPPFWPIPVLETPSNVPVYLARENVRLFLLIL